MTRNRDEALVRAEAPRVNLRRAAHHVGFALGAMALCVLVAAAVVFLVGVVQAAIVRW